MIPRLPNIVVYELSGTSDELLVHATLMAWKKVVRVVAVSACPKCGNSGFDFEPGHDMDDPEAMVRCGRCGYVCRIDEFTRPVATSQQDDILQGKPSIPGSSAS